MGTKTRNVAVISLIALVLATISVLAASINWGTYHKDEVRLGDNSAANPQDPTNIGLIWTFPRLDVAPMSEEETIVDMRPSEPTESSLRPVTGWGTPEELGLGTPGDFYGDSIAGILAGYYWSKAKPNDSAPTAWAKWFLPAKLVPDGKARPFQVQVWFPSSGGSRVNSPASQFTVSQGGAGTTCVVDQTHGGTWVDLQQEPFLLGPGDYVELSNVMAMDRVTYETREDKDDLIVVADAVRFVPSTGVEMYSSPASGRANVDTDGSEIPAVWIGTVESPVASLAAGIKDFGAIYCVRSYMGDAFKGGLPIDWTDREVTGVGTPAWRYPHGGAYDIRIPTNPDTLDRLPVEGPIGRIGSVGGVFSSPTLVMVGGELAVIVGGMDGQVYCINATSGQLIWKGPGVTISEPLSGLPAGWMTYSPPDPVPDPTKKYVPTTGRHDAFGGVYINSFVDSGVNSIFYDITGTDSDPGSDSALQDGTGHMYAIYAWMPGLIAGDTQRTKDALYKITYYDPITKASKTDSVEVNQASDNANTEDPNVGRWVRVGGSFWNPRTIELSTESKIGDTTRVVVADAIMVVPENIGAFSYSTAVWDGVANGDVYIGNTNGRVYAFHIAGGSHLPSKNNAVELYWTFPRVQTKNPVTNLAKDGAASPFGSIVSSPAFAPGKVIVPSTDGKIYAIMPDGSDLVKRPDDKAWIYDAKNDDQTISFEQESFSSSPAIFNDNDKVYVGSTGGRMHAIDLSDGHRLWLYPIRNRTNPVTGEKETEVPLSPFRFSTPTAFTLAGQTKIYCGSTGGKVIGLVDGGNAASEDMAFAQPNFWAPIQSSVALDPQNMFVGTLGTGDGDDGGLWWVNRFTGDTTDPANNQVLWSGWGNLGMVFSSPAVANDYVYVGTGKGRLCAFSSIAFGGQWVGGAEGSQPPGQQSKPPTPASATQADIFSATAYKVTQEAFEKWAADGQLTTGDIKSLVTSLGAADFFVDSSFDGTIPMDGHKKAHPGTGASPRQIYLEWGEDLCLIAWNINPLSELAGSGSTDTGVGNAPKKNSVKFRFVNSSGGAGAGGSIPQKNADYLFQYRDSSSGQLHCVAMAKLELKADNRNPPAPGSGWTVSVSVSLDQSGKKIGAPTAVVPVLEGSPGNWTPTAKWEEQPIGINNPLAIWTGNGDLAWPGSLGDGLYTPNSADPEAHFNGNGAVVQVGNTSQYTEFIPKLYLGKAAHGSNSPIGLLGVMDRSAVGLRVTVPSNDPMVDPPLRTDMITSFRLQTSDMHWVGGTAAVGNSGGVLLPWDYPPVFDFGVTGTYQSRMQRDYPDISRREQSFQKSPNNNDPSIEKSDLQPALAKDPTSNVVDYQNCWLRADQVESWVQVPQFQPANLSGPGYTTTITAFLDTNNNGRFDGGNNIAGRPTSYTETYRKFDLALDVQPDYHVVVERPLTIDITGPDRALAPHGLGIGLDPINLKDWFKEFTVRNLGNVNMPNMKIGKHLRNGVASSWSLNMYAENVNPFFPLSGANILSSFDGWDPKWLDIDVEPFKTANFGYTLSKSRVGEVNGMELTIPDARKCLEWPGITGPEIDAKMALDPSYDSQKDFKNEGIFPSVSVLVPLTQPSGSYHQQIPVFADFNGDNVLDLGQGGEPFTDPTFRLNVVVAEDRMTGGPTPGSAPQIDDNPPAGSAMIVSGNAQPTAWRDPTSGDVHVFWSSNRFASGNPTPNSPWYIAHAALRYDSQNNPLDMYTWLLQTAGTSNMWWQIPQSSDPDFQLPAFGWPTPIPAGSVSGPVKHSAPWATVNGDSGKVWLFWQGQVDMRNVATKKIERQSLIFYTPATGGQITGGGASVYSIGRDVSLPKMNPRAASYNSGGSENIWLTWHGGDSGRWSIFGNLNGSPADAHDANAWSTDVRFLTPTCLVSVSEPSPMYRKIGQSDKFLDLAYTGMSKYDQASDVIYTRYQWSGDPKNPKVDPVPLPRVYNEELLRDAKKNVYTSEHLAWLRPPSGGAIDLWGKPAAIGAVPPTEPFIRVELTDGTVISGTNGSVSGPGGTQAGAAIAPEVDRATGNYTYALPGVAKTLLGQMIVDFSAGIVRFTNPLPPTTRVYADYVPQARRLTRGQEQDNAPFMFIEKTPMMFDKVISCPNPGLVVPSGYNGPTPTDRMWLLWRKAKTGVQASIISYKSYRLTAHLDPTKPVELSKEGRPTDSNISLTNTLGPCEVSWDGKKLYFTAVDERYPGMASYPGPIKITYAAKGQGQPITVNIDTLTWEEEVEETSLPTRQNVNEGQICAFADPSVTPSKIWVFWSSTRAGQTDLYYQTISPNFKALY